MSKLVNWYNEVRLFRALVIWVALAASIVAFVGSIQMAVTYLPPRALGAILVGLAITFVSWQLSE